ncbi:glycerophosphodiester phosphodiesterase family protein [Knoellia subterranea]|uniref:Glycerophosphoryl diester phosphodiesterase n=1 Tax=Knoellia subterranea KCTC 19937 TaxID=1385521 RepID=A0A0A0JK45_9MICO|nr:glycerophosphodiester phosphodiesterase family protein [Knoellia subterranea]KGN37124.1 glycerophosphoryl diester phosphodiesterase [Knoellia subterranea KCTC 19937]
MHAEERPGGRPLVIAHRGASSLQPEHTLAAYTTAFDLGVDGIECDVRLTADHHLVCVHDRRANRTSNGTGVISTLELARLEELDWASWKVLDDGSAPEAADEDPERGRILTLRRLLTSLVDQNQELLTLIETKHPTRYGGLVERQLVTVLREFGLTIGDLPNLPHVRVMSFSLLALMRMRGLAPQIPLVYLVEAAAPRMSFDGSLPSGVNAVGLDVRIVRRSPSVVRAHQRRGHDVYVWTVNEREDVERCLELGVDVLISDRPRDVMALLD